MKKQIRFLEDSLVIGDILVISDLHIGNDDFMEESLFEKLEQLFDYLKKEKIGVKKIVVLGDIKDKFGEINDIEWRGVIRLLDFLLSKIKDKEDLIIIKGNHDSVLKPILDKRNIVLRDFYILDDLGFIHGNKLYKECEDCKILFMGHFHPLVTLKDKYKSERYKCFLKGIYDKKEIYILPNFNPIYTGFSFGISDNEEFSDIKERDLKNFQVIIYDSKERKDLSFGKLKKYID